MNTKKQNGKYVISLPTGMEHQSLLADGLVFYGEIRQRSIPHGSHWPLQVGT